MKADNVLPTYSQHSIFHNVIDLFFQSRRKESKVFYYPIKAIFYLKWSLSMSLGGFFYSLFIRVNR